jgi:dTDP-glucose pyrophosphorylase
MILQNVMSIEKKPEKLKSNFTIVDLYLPQFGGINFEKCSAIP